MERFLNIYLWSTGIATAILLALPWLVYIGFMALIVPGVLMMLTPTAFLWGLIFRFAWRPLRGKYSDGRAIALATVLSVLLLFVIPTPTTMVARSTIAQLSLPDVVATAPISPAGAVRLDLIGGSSVDNDPEARLENKARPYMCDALCAALLFIPEVESVTVNTSSQLTFEDGTIQNDGLAASARTFRLLPRSQCLGRNVVNVLLDHRHEVLGEKHAEQEAYAASLLMKLASEHCVVGETPVPHADQIFREASIYYPERSRTSGWSFGAFPAEIQLFEILDSVGEIQTRVWRVRAKVPSRPLYIGLENLTAGSGFGWGRTQLTDGKQADPPLEIIAAMRAYTSLPTSLPDPATGQDVVRSLREALDAALQDPARTASDPVFHTLPTYTDALTRIAPGSADVGTLRRAILDPRVGGFWRANQFTRAFHNDLSPFRDAMTQRIFSGTEKDTEASRNLNSLLYRAIPSGAYAHMSRTEEALLADPAKRTRASALIARLADQGSVVVPRLLQILDFHARAYLDAPQGRESGWKREERTRPHFDVITGVKTAFCRLGLAGSDGLKTLEEMVHEQLIPKQIAESENWAFMLARLGKPVEAIYPQESGKFFERDRRRVRQKLDKFNITTDCGLS